MDVRNWLQLMLRPCREARIEHRDKVFRWGYAQFVGCDFHAFAQCCAMKFLQGFGIIQWIAILCKDLDIDLTGKWFTFHQHTVAIEDDEIKRRWIHRTGDYK